MTGTTIQQLNLINGKWASLSELILMTQCKDLRSLAWSTNDNPYMRLFTRGLHDQSWPHLQFLDVGDQFEDGTLSTLIDSMKQPLRALTVRGPNSFGPYSNQSLLRGKHQTHLVVLKIANSTLVAGAWIQTILCSFPKLEVLHAGELNDADIFRNPRPWICTRMRDFQVQLAFALSRGEPFDGLFSDKSKHRNGPHPLWPLDLPQANPMEDTTNVFLDRLATLTYLKRLSIGFCDDSTHKWSSTRAHYFLPRLAHQTVELEFGLDRLKSLWRLQELDMGDTFINMTMEEAQWIVTFWPGLERLSASHLNPNPEVTKELWTFFKAHGIANMRKSI